MIHLDGSFRSVPLELCIVYGGPHQVCTLQMDWSIGLTAHFLRGEMCGQSIKGWDDQESPQFHTPVRPGQNFRSCPVLFPQRYVGGHHCVYFFIFNLWMLGHLHPKCLVFNSHHYNDHSYLILSLINSNSNFQFAICNWLLILIQRFIEQVHSICCLIHSICGSSSINSMK